MGLEQGCRQWLGENVNYLELCLYMGYLDFAILNFLTNGVAIQFDVLGSFIVNWIGCNIKCSFVVTK
jgi:hypothetical protein